MRGCCRACNWPAPSSGAPSDGIKKSNYGRVTRHAVAVGCDTCSCIPSVGHATGPPSLPPPPSTKQRSSCNHVGGHAVAVGCGTCSCGAVVGLATSPSPLSEQKSPLAVGLQDMQLQMGHDNQSCMPSCIHATPHSPLPHTHKTTHSCITRQYLQLHG